MIERVIVVPDWDIGFFKVIRSLTEDRISIHMKRFSAGNSNNSSMGMNELVEKYGRQVMKEAKQEGERVNANVAVLHSILGYGELIVDAHYFSLG
jgi:hypothetical protein